MLEVMNYTQVVDSIRMCDAVKIHTEGVIEREKKRKNFALRIMRYIFLVPTEGPVYDMVRLEELFNILRKQVQHIIHSEVAKIGEKHKFGQIIWLDTNIEDGGITNNKEITIAILYPSSEYACAAEDIPDIRLESTGKDYKSFEQVSKLMEVARKKLNLVNVPRGTLT